MKELDEINVVPLDEREIKKRFDFFNNLTKGSYVFWALFAFIVCSFLIKPTEDLGIAFSLIWSAFFISFLALCEVFWVLDKKELYSTKLSTSSLNSLLKWSEDSLLVKEYIVKVNKMNRDFVLNDYYTLSDLHHKSYHLKQKLDVKKKIKAVDYLDKDNVNADLELDFVKLSCTRKIKQ